LHGRIPGKDVEGGKQSLSLFIITGESEIADKLAKGGGGAALLSGFLARGLSGGFPGRIKKKR